MATKSHILPELRRRAEKNSGVPLGRQRFYVDTGIKESDWQWFELIPQDVAAFRRRKFM